MGRVTHRAAALLATNLNAWSQKKRIVKLRRGSLGRAAGLAVGLHASKSNEARVGEPTGPVVGAASVCGPMPNSRVKLLGWPKKPALTLAGNPARPHPLLAGSRKSAAADGFGQQRAGHPQSTAIPSS